MEKVGIEETTEVAEMESACADLLRAAALGEVGVAGCEHCAILTSDGYGAYCDLCGEVFA